MEYDKEKIDEVTVELLSIFRLAAADLNPKYRPQPKSWDSGGLAFSAVMRISRLCQRAGEIFLAISDSLLRSLLRILPCFLGLRSNPSRGVDS